MILYHGTTLKAWNNIKKSDIDVTINVLGETDFGYGFYVGTKEYAKMVAFEKAKFGNEGTDAKIPVLIKLNIDVEKIIESIKEKEPDKILIFKKRSVSFARCVFNNRYHIGEDMLHVDFVVAPLADGKVDDVMTYYKDKENFFRKLVCLINYLKPQYLGMKQYVFKKQGLCSVKDVVLVTELNEGRIVYEQDITNI